MPPSLPRYIPEKSAVLPDPMLPMLASPPGRRREWKRLMLLLNTAPDNTVLPLLERRGLPESRLPPGGEVEGRHGSPLEGARASDPLLERWGGRDVR